MRVVRVVRVVRMACVMRSEDCVGGDGVRGGECVVMG